MDEFNKTLEQELARGAKLSIIDLLDLIIKHASRIHASDIHIDPLEKSIRVRFRVDGVLEDSHSLPKNIHGEIISRIKILSRLRTDEHQATQDGRFRHVFPGTNEFLDIRVSIVPTYHGENAVMRLLSDKAENLTLENLGFSENDRSKIIHALT